MLQPDVSEALRSLTSESLIPVYSQSELFTRSTNAIVKTQRFHPGNAHDGQLRAHRKEFY